MGAEAPAALDEVRHKLPVIQVIVIEGVGVNVRVPRGADQGLFPNRIALERLGDEVQNQLLGEHVGFGLALGNLDQPGKHTRAAGDQPQLALAILPFQGYGGKNLLVAHEGKWLALVHNHRREQGRDVRIEVPLQVRAFLLGDFAEVHQAHAFALQAVHQLLIDLILAAVQLPGLGEDGLQLLGGGHVGLVLPIGFVHGHLVNERPHPHHEEFIQIALENRNEAQPFAKRNVLPFRFLQHALVKF